MAIYTHFGGMTELRREIRREGFARLGARQAEVAATGDPIADLCVLRTAYYRNAIENPNLYQAMFMDGPIDDADAGVGLDTFGQLVTTVQRGIDAGRMNPADPVVLATQLWALVHGLVTLELARLLSPDQVLACLDDGARNLITAFGDDPRAFGRSLPCHRTECTPDRQKTRVHCRSRREPFVWRVRAGRCRRTPGRSAMKQYLLSIYQPDGDRRRPRFWSR